MEGIRSIHFAEDQRRENPLIACVFVDADTTRESAEQIVKQLQAIWPLRQFRVMADRPDPSYVELISLP